MRFFVCLNFPGGGFLYNVERNSPGSTKFFGGVARAGLWLLSGQVPQGIDFVQTPIPWMTEFENRSPVVDRDQFPMLWELGRAASLSYGQIEKLFCLKSAAMARETILRGMSPNHGLVTAHVTTQKNSVSFQKHFGLKPLGRVSVEPYHEVLADQLSGFIQRYKPSDVLASVKNVVRLTGLSEFEAIHLLHQAHSVRRRVLDIEYTDGASYQGPIHIFDHSSFTRPRYLELSSKSKEASRDELINYLYARDNKLDESYLKPNEIPWHRRYSEWLKGKDWIVITGTRNQLNPELSPLWRLPQGRKQAIERNLAIVLVAALNDALRTHSEIRGSLEELKKIQFAYLSQNFILESEILRAFFPKSVTPSNHVVTSFIDHGKGETMSYGPFQHYFVIRGDELFEFAERQGHVDRRLNPYQKNGANYVDYVWRNPLDL